MNQLDKKKTKLSRKLFITCWMYVSMVIFYFELELFIYNKYVTKLVWFEI